jgi:hypothetical protein
MLAQKVSGTSAGLWLLVPEMLRLGLWDILKVWTGQEDNALELKIALQMVNESALCTNRVRRKNSLGHQGFQLINECSIKRYIFAKIKALKIFAPELTCC